MYQTNKYYFYKSQFRKIISLNHKNKHHKCNHSLAKTINYSVALIVVLKLVHIFEAQF